MIKLVYLLLISMALYHITGAMDGNLESIAVVVVVVAAVVYKRKFNK